GTRLAGCLLVLASPLVLPAARAQEEPGAADLLRDVEIDVLTRPDSLTVGDRVTLEIRVRAPISYQVLFPRSVRAGEGPVEVKDLEVVPPAGRSGSEAAPGGALDETGHDVARDLWIARYALSVYEVGDVVLPPWPVQVRAETLDAVAHTDSIHLWVESVLDDSLAAADIQDIKGQYGVPVPIPAWVWAGLGALVAVALLVWWWARRRRRRVEPVPVVPPRPAHEVALAELRKLETQRLPLDGMIKEHYVQLSEILRIYMEDAPRFGLAALEETTGEILAELRRKEYRDSVVNEVAALCGEADLVKFAKHEPTVDECMAALARVRSFVVSTSKPSALLRRRAPEPVLVGSASAGTTGDSHPSGGSLE
ncbi:MAG: hypothetical protein ACE5G2_08720, partial [Candidatus Krumholzibacteriia bacterium]